MSLKKVLGWLVPLFLLLLVVAQGLVLNGIVMHMWSLWPAYLGGFLCLVGFLVWAVAQNSDDDTTTNTTTDDAETSTTPTTDDTTETEPSDDDHEPGHVEQDIRVDNTLDRAKPTNATERIGIGIALVGFATVAISAVSIGYWKDRAYLTSVDTTPVFAPDYKTRGAFVAARAQAQTSITINGELQNTKYLATSNTFTTPVRLRGPISGYGEVITQTQQATGETTRSSCTFDSTANKRLGGWLWSSLNREVLWATGPLKAINSKHDLSFYCDGATPIVTIPVVTMTGTFPPITVPAGVVTYNGRTGNTTYLPEVALSELPTPVYPISIAQRQRASTLAKGSIIDYWLRKVGFEDTASDTDDPNAGNRAEFLLKQDNTSSKADYVTPLTLVGQSTGIAALGVVNAASVTSGTLNTYNVHEFGPAMQRRSNSALVDRVKSDYPSLAWSSGLKVFEVTPAGQNSWVASVGLKQNVTHTVLIKPDGSSCLYTAAGSELRCSTAENDPKNEPNELVKLPTSEELKSLSDKQVAELLSKVTEESSRRLKDE